METELIFYTGSTLLESPCWDNKNNLLYCVSVEQNLIYQINTETGYVKSYKTDGNVGCVVVENSGNILEAEYNGIYRINTKTDEKTFVAQINKDKEMRYNDGKLDKKGRFIVGTKGYLMDIENRGKLFSYDGKMTKILIENTTISNGLGFSSDSRTMYFIDTPTKKVGKYKYDLETGDTVFEKYIVEIKDGYPDGMCVDIEDNLWVAEWNRGKVSKWEFKTGRKLDEIILPCKNVSSCCLGGKNLEYLFVTTAKSDLKEESAGGLFKAKL